MKFVIYKIRKGVTLQKIAAGNVIDECHRRPKSFAFVANREDDDSSPIPASLYKVEIYSDDHIPAHFHVLSKNPHWSAKYDLQTGNLIYDDARSEVHIDADTVTSKIKTWLALPSVSKRANGETNHELMWKIWRSFNGK